MEAKCRRTAFFKPSAKIFSFEFRSCRFYKHFAIFYTLAIDPFSIRIKLICNNRRCIFACNNINGKMFCFKACMIAICNICNLISGCSVYMINRIFFSIYVCVSNGDFYPVIRLNRHAVWANDGNIVCFIAA